MFYGYNSFFYYSLRILPFFESFFLLNGPLPPSCFLKVFFIIVSQYSWMFGDFCVSACILEWRAPKLFGRCKNGWVGQELWRVLPHFQTNKLICCIFIDAPRRHEIPGSDTKDIITHSSARSMSFLVTVVPLAPKISQGQYRASKVGPHYVVGLCHTWGLLSSRNSNHL